MLTEIFTNLFHNKHRLIYQPLKMNEHKQTTPKKIGLKGHLNIPTQNQYNHNIV